MKVDQPRITGPLPLSGLGSSLGVFSIFFILVIHTTQMFISTHKKINKSIGKRVGEQGCYMLRTQVLTFHF